MKKNLNIIILGLAALSLSSCKTLYGKYERPDVKTSGIVRDVASDTDTLAVKDTTTFANIPWRSVFTDPQLQSIIEKGLNNNVNLLNAALNVKMADDQIIQRAAGQQGGEVLQPGLGHGGIHRIQQQSLFVQDQVGVVADAPGNGKEILKQGQAAVTAAQPIGIGCNEMHIFHGEYLLSFYKQNGTG